MYTDKKKRRKDFTFCIGLSQKTVIFATIKNNTENNYDTSHISWNV